MSKHLLVQWLFNWETWASSTPDSATAGAFGDALVILEPVSGGGGRNPKLRTIRRHFPWTATATIKADGKRTLAIGRADGRVGFRLETLADGQFAQLSISKRKEQPAKSGPFQPVASERKEIILGETCTWFNMMPKVADAGLEECQTDDGLVLKSVSSGRGRPLEILVATRIERAPVALAGVLPPPAVFIPKNWGITD